MLSSLTNDKQILNEYLRFQSVGTESGDAKLIGSFDLSKSEKLRNIPIILVQYITKSFAKAKQALPRCS